MNELLRTHVRELRTGLTSRPTSDVLSALLGGRTALSGIWRFFSQGDAETWNAPGLWRGAWAGLSQELFFFGEDIFGNQLTLVPRSENVWLWNHENSALSDLQLDPGTLLETVIESG